MDHNQHRACQIWSVYIFVHRLLMEHFASLNSEQATTEPVEAQRTTP